MASDGCQLAPTKASSLSPSKQSQQSQPLQQHRHQRNKSSVLRSFIMNRQSEPHGENGPATPRPTGSAAATRGGPKPLEETSHNRQQERPNYSHGGIDTPGLGAQKSRVNEGHLPLHSTPSSPTKNTKLSKANDQTPGPSGKKTRSTTNFVGLLSRSKSMRGLRHSPQKESPAADDAARAAAGFGKKKNKDRQAKDKENCTPPGSTRDGLPTDAAVLSSPPPPIYAQFCSQNGQDGQTSQGSLVSGLATHPPSAGHFDNPAPARSSMEIVSGRESQPVVASKRPKSFHPTSQNNSMHVGNVQAGSAQARTRMMKQMGTGAGHASGSQDSVPFIDPSEINAHLEALLDRRNIPEHQRYKMRNLADGIKMEFIRQDWAEDRAKRERPLSHDSMQALETPGGADSPQKAAGRDMPDAAAAQTATPDPQSPTKAGKSKHSRVKSMTLSRVTRGRSRDRGEDGAGGSGGSGSGSSVARRLKSPGLTLRKKAEGTLGRHLRSKSTENFGAAADVDAADAAGTASATSALSGSAMPLAGLFRAKAPQQNTPGDFVHYLRTVQEPQHVEVGKLHKLRLLLRNETVAWTDDFVMQGGMDETVGLLHRILAVEWREEHEDALLHENLLCLKALCTTELALQNLDAKQASLLPALIHMIFDPEKKGPSEFTTRNIVTWVLFTYIQSVTSPEERTARAQTVLGYLHDPQGDEADRPVSFVLDMRKDRPYRVWCKEVVSVTKEVFWIFLHHLNVVSLPAAAKGKKTADNQPAMSGQGDEGIDGANLSEHPPHPPSHAAGPPSSYMTRNFPQERPPVPAAPYVGGVEWEATNYLASHLDLVNAILACLPTASDRNQLRQQLQVSGWERCMGGSLRLCKEKFYGAVHIGLRTWVAAAYEDGWDVRDVRFGPPPPAPASSADRKVEAIKKPAVGGPLAETPAPKIDIPKLDFVLDGEGL